MLCRFSWKAVFLWTDRCFILQGLFLLTLEMVLVLHCPGIAQYLGLYKQFL